MMNKTQPKLLPSLLAFNKVHWRQDVGVFLQHDLDALHFDVMDEGYVHNTAYDQHDYQYLLSLDARIKGHVHLMVLNPYWDCEKYFHHQTEVIYFHFDVYEDKQMVHQTLKKIKQQGIACGIAINPNFVPEDYQEFLNECDGVVVMGVYPGKGGQAFEPSCLVNLKFLTDYKQTSSPNFQIEVDGGMNYDTIPSVYAFSQYIVTGSFLAQRMDQLTNLLSWFHNL